MEISQKSKRSKVLQANYCSSISMRKTLSVVSVMKGVIFMFLNVNILHVMIVGTAGLVSIWNVRHVDRGLGEISF